MWLHRLLPIEKRLDELEAEVGALKSEIDCERVGHKWEMHEGVFKPWVGCRRCNHLLGEKK